jgi:membrane protein YqaA with SNARE-associated domain
MELLDWGYSGMFVGALLAATLLPFGSEILFLGLLYQKFDPVILTLVAGLGNASGGMITYALGRLGKWDWLERWFRISKEKIESKMTTAQKWGWLYAFFTWLPGIGDPMAALIGFVRIPIGVAAFWMWLGKTIRFASIAYLWHLSNPQ